MNDTSKSLFMYKYVPIFEVVDSKRWSAKKLTRWRGKTSSHNLRCQTGAPPSLELVLMGSMLYQVSISSFPLFAVTKPILRHVHRELPMYISS
jgi:hypothetical protein